MERSDRPERPGKAERLVAPLDAADPRFAGSAEAGLERPRRLVESAGPGASPESRGARWLRLAVPLVFVGAVLTVGFVFYAGLDPSSGVQVVGDEQRVRAAVAERPHRICLNGALPCGWLTVVDGELLALNTSGPLREEYGRLGVAWCPTSRHFGSNSSGSRFDPAGLVVRGPAPRSLDRFGLHVDERDRVVVNFFSQTIGLQAGRVEDPAPPTGPDCDPVPFDRDADLDLEARLEAEG